MLFAFGLAWAAAFQPQQAHHHQRRRAASAVMVGPRPLHWDGFKSQFTVEKATEAQLRDLGVKSWPTWSTQGSAKYKTGVKSPLKVYDENELSYIISGKMEITPEGGEPVLVQAGDFVTFPEDFRCFWYVIEEVRDENSEYCIPPRCERECPPAPCEEGMLTRWRPHTSWLTPAPPPPCAPPAASRSIRTGTSTDREVREGESFRRADRAHRRA